MSHSLISTDALVDQCFACGQSFDNLNDNVVLTSDNAPSQWVPCPGPTLRPGKDTPQHYWTFRHGLTGIDGVECHYCLAFIGWHDTPTVPAECEPDLEDRL